jgi:hypothetical protein
MKSEIIGKLREFLNQHSPIRDESDAVYLMVELRKLLDRQEEEIPERLFPLIRFYADWTVHTRKDYITPRIQEIMGKVDENLNSYPKEGNLNFLSMPI